MGCTSGKLSKSKAHTSFSHSKVKKFQDREFSVYSKETKINSTRDSHAEAMQYPKKSKDIEKFFKQLQKVMKQQEQEEDLKRKLQEVEERKQLHFKSFTLAKNFQTSSIVLRRKCEQLPMQEQQKMLNTFRQQNSKLANIFLGDNAEQNSMKKVIENNSIL